MRSDKNILGFLIFIFLISFLLIPDRTFAVFNASDVIGQTDYLGNPIFTTNSAFNANFAKPSSFNVSRDGIALDDINHRLFVPDESNNRVLVFNLNPDGTYVDREADYVLGQSDFFSKIATTTQNGMASPRAVSYDSKNQRLFVADTYRVLVFDVSTSTITNGMNASYELGQIDFTSRSGVTSQNNISGANLAIVYDSITDRIFVSANSRILVFDVATSTITNGAPAINVLGQADYSSSVQMVNATTSGSSNSNGGLSIDSQNQRLFVSDQNGKRVLIFDVSTSTIVNGMPAINVLGQTDFTSSVSTTTQNGMSFPYGTAYDPSSNRIFISECSNNGNKNRILAFDVSTSTITNGMNASHVIGQTDFTSSSAYVTQNGLNCPWGMAVDSDNQKLFVMDVYNNRILTFNVSTSTISNGMNAVDVLGQTDLSGNPSYTTGNRNDSKFVSLFTPTTAIVDNTDHHLFIESRGINSNTNGILVFNLDSNNNLVSKIPDYILTKTPGTDLGIIFGLAYDNINKRLFASDFGSGRIVVYDLSSGINNNLMASYVLGKPDFNAVFDQSTFNATATVGVYDLEYDSVNQRLFATDGIYDSRLRWNTASRILVFDVSTSTITNGMSASYVLGQANFTAGSTLTNATTTGTRSIKGAAGLALDSSNDLLFVADKGNNRVLVFDVATSTIANGSSTIYVLGQNSTTTFTSAITQNGFSGPEGLTYDSLNKQLFITDINRTLIYDLSSGISTGMNASAVIGQPNFASNTATVSQSILNASRGISIDENNRKVYVADSSANRIMVFSLIHLINNSLPSGTVGAPYSTTVNSENSQGTLSFEIASGTLPIGLTLDTSTGIISGTPTTVGTYSFTIKARDNIGDAGVLSDSVDQSISISNAPVINSSKSGGTRRSAITIPNSFVTLPVITTNPNSGNVSRFIFTRSLIMGNNNPEVKELQNYLNSRGYTVTDNLTEFFGPKTKESLIRFQRDHNIPATGFFGPITRNYVNSTLSSSTTPVTLQIYNFTKDLSFGMNGGEVTVLQNFLNSKGYELPITGYFGNLTKEALIDYQKKNNISPAKGYFGPKTRASVK